LLRYTVGEWWGNTGDTEGRGRIIGTDLADLHGFFVWVCYYDYEVSEGSAIDYLRRPSMQLLALES